MAVSVTSIFLFLSTPSARRATKTPIAIAAAIANFYPRPPRGGRPFRFEMGNSGKEISIHALREEGDWKLYVDITDDQDFYPRPPRGGRRGGLAAFNL